MMIGYGTPGRNHSSVRSIGGGLIYRLLRRFNVVITPDGVRLSAMGLRLDCNR